MKSKVILAVVIFLFLGTALFGAGYLLGQKNVPEETVSFYAVVLDNDGTGLLVSGIPENDINHRGEFRLTLKNPDDRNSLVDESGIPISLSDIKTDDEVQVTYSGPVLESYPVQIPGVIRIRLLS